MERTTALLRRRSRTGPPPVDAARVMIVDDSLIARTVFTRIAEESGDFCIAATAGTAEKALDQLKATTVDIILLDLQMPGMGGLDALPRIIAAGRGARILVVSSLAVEGAEQTLAALSLGAADTLSKPVSGKFDSHYCEAMLAKMRALGRRRDRVATAEAQIRAPQPRIRPTLSPSAKILAIGASTGGIHALSMLFSALPRRMGLPILVTQHLPASFMPVFARQLATASGLDALVAEEDMPVLPDTILVAPGDGHLTIRQVAGRLIVHISRQSVTSGCMPSVDPMFASLAKEYGAGALGVVLSGMGRDGADGAAKIAAAEGTIFAQDEASSAVWGMPRAVAEGGLASAVLPPEQIAQRIAMLIGAIA